MSYKDFFIHHLEDDIQNRYSLDDEEMATLMDFLKQFETDHSSSLKMMRRKENQDHLDSIVQEVLQKELAADSHRDIQMAPVTQQDALTFPMGIPLSQEKIVMEPHHYEGGYTF